MRQTRNSLAGERDKGRSNFSVGPPHETIEFCNTIRLIADEEPETASTSDAFLAVVRNRAKNFVGTGSGTQSKIANLHVLDQCLGLERGSPLSGLKHWSGATSPSIE
jgi:hypothetical protein